MIEDTIDNIINQFPTIPKDFVGANGLSFEQFEKEWNKLVPEIVPEAVQVPECPESCEVKQKFLTSINTAEDIKDFMESKYAYLNDLHKDIIFFEEKIEHVRNLIIETQESILPGIQYIIDGCKK